MKLTFLVDNKTEDIRCTAEWGLSIFIESEGHKYLYDTGASDMFVENAKNMGLNIEECEACMISHGHFDHTNGIEAFVDNNKTASVYIHKNACHHAFGMEDDKIDDYNCGVTWDEETFGKLKERFVFTEGVYKLNDNLTLVGNIPSIPGYSPTERFFKYENGKLVSDNMEHEQFLAVFEGDTMHIISGCCHKGAIPTIAYAKQLFPDKKIGAFVGGMHTYMLKNDERIKVSDKLMEMGVQKVLPLHCTGMNMIITLKERLGSVCEIKCAGDTFEI